MFKYRILIAFVVLVIIEVLVIYAISPSKAPNGMAVVCTSKIDGTVIKSSVRDKWHISYKGAKAWYSDDDDDDDEAGFYPRVGDECVVN